MSVPTSAAQSDQAAQPVAAEEQLGQQSIDRLTLAIGLAQSKLSYTRGQLRRCRLRRLVAQCAHFYAVESARLRRLVRLSVEYYPVGILLGSALGGAVGYFLSSSILAAILTLCASSLLLTAMLYIPEGDDLEAWTARIRSRLDETSLQRARLALKVKSTAEQMTSLVHERAAVIESIAAQKLRESTLARRKLLLAREWKSLRSAALASYLQDVFRELGYTVEATRAVDEQGADLILSKSSHKLAVRVKGYFDSVGDAAVQESQAAQVAYHCEGCAVVTNSRFTIAAQELASQHQCVLIDESFFPSLVLGHLDLWDQCCSLRIHAELVYKRSSSNKTT